MQAFYLGTRLYTGLDSLKEILEGEDRVLIVTDRFLKESGMTARVTSLLEEQGIAWRIFSQISPNPDTETVGKGVASLLDFKPGALIGFGGGSAIDAAKAIRYFGRRQGGLSCRFTAIPTTSGTGSEASRFSIISKPEKAVKYPLIDEALLPDAAVLDASLVCSAPPSVTADTGIDVLTHAIEALVATGANGFTDAAAEKALILVKENLLRAYRKPDDLDAREGMHTASSLAGMAFSNAGLGLNHGMAHTLGERFHIPHGRANGLLLPHVIRFNAFGPEGNNRGEKEGQKRYARLAVLLRLEGSTEGESVRRLIRYTERLLEQLHMPRCAKEAGIKREDWENAIEPMTAVALADACTGSNPRVCGVDEVRELFRKVYDAGGRKGYRDDAD